MDIAAPRVWLPFFLKKLSNAIADGNPILATVPATAVYQNLKCTRLFVPNSPSLSHLFKDVIQAANLEANDISLVEAHGTGTLSATLPSTKAYG